MSNRWRLWLLGIVVGAAAILWMGGAAFAQQGPDDALIRAVRLFLGKQLNRSISQIDTYTYANASFADSSFGCPETGKTYDPGPFTGYKFLVTVQGIVYDVRSTTDGVRMVLCAGSDVKQNVGLSTYRTPTYTLLYPTDWNATERSGDVYFGLNNRPACVQPGMTIAVQEAAGKTPDELIDQYRQGLDNAQVDKERLSIGKIGRSVLYVAPCTDNTPRQHRLSYIVAYGRAFRIDQFAPQAAFGQWAEMFLKILNDFAPAGGGGGQANGPIVAPALSPRAALIHIFNGNVYAGLLVDLPGLALTSGGSSTRSFRSAVPAPVGEWVAYVDPFQKALNIAPRNPLTSRQTARKLADGVFAGMPIAWSPDGASVVYFSSALDSPNALTLNTVTLSGQISKIGAAFTLDPICLALMQGSAEPGETLYRSELATAGMVYWSKAGPIYYSQGCGVGLARIDPKTGTSEVLTTTLAHPSISPDERAVIGINVGQSPAVVRLTLADKTIVSLKSAAALGKETPDLAAWSSDGKSIYYAALTLKDPLKLSDSADAERGKRIFGLWPVEIVTGEVALRRINLESGVDEELFKTDGRGIANIAPSPDGAGVLFTVIPDSSKLVEGFKNNVAQGELRALMPAVRLYWATGSASDGAQLVAMSSAPVWGTVDSAPAPTPTAGIGRTAQPSLTPTATFTATPRVAATRTLVIVPTNTPRPSATPTAPSKP